VPIDFEVD